MSRCNTRDRLDLPSIHLLDAQDGCRWKLRVDELPGLPGVTRLNLRRAELPVEADPSLVGVRHEGSRLRGWKHSGR